MTLSGSETTALDGWLAGNFADADLAGLNDDQAAVEGLDADTVGWYRDVLREGRAALAAPVFDWQHVADYANRNFADKEAARRWLQDKLDLLEAALGRI